MRRANYPKIDQRRTSSTEPDDGITGVDRRRDKGETPGHKVSAQKYPLKSIRTKVTAQKYRNDLSHVKRRNQ